MNAVVTADIVNYTKLSEEEADLLLNTINTEFNNIENFRTNIISNFSIKRGDSIQLEIEKASSALRISLLLKSLVNKIDFNNNKRKRPKCDVRIAIGVGYISSRRINVNESTGDAYINSGRTLDNMKANKQLIAIKTNDQRIDHELDTEFKLLEVIIQGWNVYSAEVIYWKLLGLNEKQIAKELNITQSAINQRKRNAGWNGIEALLQRFKTIIK